MSKKSDDSIERIFRQALTQYDTTFQESDWVKMEKLLNEEANRRAAARSKRIKGTAYTLTGLTGLIIAVYFLAFRNPSSPIAGLDKTAHELQATGDLEKKGNVKLEDQSDGLLSDNEPSNTARGALQEKGQESPGKISRGNAGIKKEGIQGDIPSGKDTNASSATYNEASAGQRTRLQADEAKPESAPGLIESRSTPSLGANESQVGSGTQRRQSAASSAPAANGIGIEEDSQSVTGNLADTAAQSGREAGNTVPEAIELSALSGNTHQGESNLTSPGSQKSGSVTQDSVTLQSNTFTVGADSLTRPSGESEKQKVRPPYRWSLDFIIAPEYSTANLGEYSAPGLSLGLRVGYQISSKLNINTGFIRSMKKYDGDGYDYTPRNPMYWQIRTNGVVPEEIDSKCLVYELPIGVQFDAIQTPKSRLFLSAAVSSYFMISQAYDYTFDSPNPGADTGWRSAGSESYWFDVGMISAGYEWSVQRSLAIGIEPYLKVSFGEIGWPNIKLFSGGAYVTLRYRFMNQKNFQ